MESDRIKKAEELSRGNVYLKQAIICLWNLGIKDFTLGFGDASKKELPYVCFPRRLIVSPVYIFYIKALLL